MRCDTAGTTWREFEKPWADNSIAGSTQQCRVPTISVEAVDTF